MAIAGNSIDVFIPIDKEKTTQVHLQVLRGDITSEDTEVLVVFREPDGRASGDSSRILKEAGQSVEGEYQHVKSQGGRYVNKGVVQTAVGNLDNPKYILHLHVENNLAKFRETVSTALRAAEKLGDVKSIAFPSLPDDLKSFEFIEAIVEVFEQFTKVDRPLSLHFIQAVIMQSTGRLARYASQKHDEEFEMYKGIVLQQAARGTMFAVTSPSNIMPYGMDQSMQMIS